jgi:hypothetical protein
MLMEECSVSAVEKRGLKLVRWLLLVRVYEGLDGRRRGVVVVDVVVAAAAAAADGVVVRRRTPRRRRRVLPSW